MTMGRFGCGGKKREEEEDEMRKGGENMYRRMNVYLREIW